MNILVMCHTRNWRKWADLIKQDEEWGIPPTMTIVSIKAKPREIFGKNYDLVLIEGMRTEVPDETLFMIWDNKIPTYEIRYT